MSSVRSWTRGRLDQLSLRASEVEPYLASTRQLTALAAVALLAVLGFLPDNDLAQRLAWVAFVGLAIATLTGLGSLLTTPRSASVAATRSVKDSRFAWGLAAIAVAVVTAYAVQTWFEPGRTIAGGDLVDHAGSGWTTKLFVPWTWSGTTMGEPSQLTALLPWAVILRGSEAFGGGPELAQRIWYTILYVAAGLSALWLLAGLRISPLGAAAGALVYAFNPYVLTWVNPYDVYMAALVLVAAIPAVLVSAATRRVRWWFAAVVVGFSAPLLGYAYQSPPLVGMVLATLVGTPALVAWLDGRQSGWMAAKTALLALAVLGAMSAYWAVPVALHIASSIPPQYQAISTWAWTEIRANIRNAFWLNTSWGWNTYEFFPYASSYTAPPLSAISFLLPAIAFTPFTLRWRLAGTGTSTIRWHARVVVAAGLLSLGVILISTGTKFPGSIAFDALYGLPFGWLLREPSRFLMFAALGYALLTGTFVDAVAARIGAIRFPETWASRIAAFGGSLTVAMVALATSWPMLSGAVVPDTQPTLPSWAISARPTHVTTPPEWQQMAQLVDRLPDEGAVLVMPPDDWYQMPYTWYYGADAFIPELFSRDVLVPSASGYTPASTQLMSAVNTAANSMLNGDWQQVETITTALGAQFVLVRNDIVSPYANHSILSPASLSSSLARAPNFTLVARIGRLDLFRLAHRVSRANAAPSFMTVESATPDWRLISHLGHGLNVVDSKPIQGLPYASEPPSFDRWNAESSSYSWSEQTFDGWTYKVASLDSGYSAPVIKDRAIDMSGVNSSFTASNRGGVLTVSTRSRAALTDGSFKDGPWGPLGDCNPVAPANAGTLNDERLLSGAAPGGGDALQLSAGLDNACVSRPIDWKGGPLVLSAQVRNVEGLPPRMCIWQAGPNRCAPAPAIVPLNNWAAYRTSIVPESGTTSLTLYLYADADQTAKRTTNQYASIEVAEFRALPAFALIAEPTTTPPPQTLYVVHTTYSNDWAGPPGSAHVLVDGLLNGWIMPFAADRPSAGYKFAGLFYASLWVSATAFVSALVLIASMALRRAIDRRRRQNTTTDLSDR